MTNDGGYSTFDPPKRSSCPGKDVAQRLSSAWIRECCCCSFYPWKSRGRSSSALKTENEELAEEATKNGESTRGLLDKTSIELYSNRDKLPDTTTEVESSVKVTKLKKTKLQEDSNKSDDISNSPILPKTEIEVKVSEVSETGTESVLTSKIFTVSSPKIILTPVHSIFSKVMPRKKNGSGTALGASVIHETIAEDTSEASNDGSSLSEACSTPIIGAGSRAGSSHTVMDIDDMDRGLHSGHLATRASLSSLGARSDSMASVYSGAGEGRWCGSVAVRGEVEFSLQYDYKQLTFEVHVTQCKDLAPVDIKRNRSDPYVKVYLLPDKSKSGKRKTKVKKHTLNPVFDETLKFHMSLTGLETRTLWLTVWHSDMFGRNDFLGEVRMPLENKIFDDPTPRWYPLQERTEPFDDPISYKGEVIVGLKFIPPDPAQLERERETSIDHRGLSKGRKNWSRGSLHVLVKEARNLQTRAKNSGTCDPFCKSYLLPDKGRSGKQKTGVVRRSGGSPVWTHTFVYKDVSLQELAERGLELTVWDHDRIASNEFLGGVRFNLGTGKHYGKVVDWMDATGRELSLWQSMLERPNFWVEGAVTLRPNLHNHVKSGGS